MNASKITLFSILLSTNIFANNWTKVVCPSDPNVMSKEAFLLLTSGYRLGSDKCKNIKFNYFEKEGVDISDSKLNIIASNLIFISSSVTKKDTNTAWITVRFKDGKTEREMPIEIFLRSNNEEAPHDDQPCGLATGNFDPHYVNKDCI